MKRYLWTNIIMMLIVGFGLASCSGSDSEGGGSGGGDWFVSSLNISFHEDDPYVLERINQLFDSSGRYGGTIYLPNGMITNGPAGSNSDIEVTHIINNTVEAYYAFLYKYDSPGTQGKTLLYRITGTALGDVAYYITSPIKTFTCSRDGNVITYTIDGRSESFTITNNELKGKDGFAMPRVSFGKTYTDNFKPVDKSELIADAKTITKTATVVGNPTFHTATFKCTFGTSAKGKTYKRVFAFSKNRADLENAEQLGSKYFMQTGGLHICQPPFYTSNLDSNPPQGSNGYLEDGDLRLADEQTGDLSNFTVAYDELDVTVYYCPVIIVANDVAVMGDINSVTMRKLKQASGYVDLGLSCQWAATNVKADTPWDFGSSIGLTDKNLSDGGRIPTKEEVLELNKCDREAIDNGFLIKGKNGNEIFIPFRDTSQKNISGYGTSSMQYKDLYDRNVVWNYNNTKREFTATASTNTRNTYAYVRAVKSGSGNGGGGGIGDIDVPSVSTDITIKDMLEKPFGVKNLNFKKASNDELLSSLNSWYNTTIIDDGTIYIYHKDNESTTNYTYHGIPFSFLYVYNFYGQPGHNLVNYVFEIEKSKIDDPNKYMLAMEKEFKEMNVPVTRTDNVNANPEISLFYFVKNTIRYDGFLENYKWSSNYRFTISVIYYGK